MVLTRQVVQYFIPILYIFLYCIKMEKYNYIINCFNQNNFLLTTQLKIWATKQKCKVKIK